MRRFLRALVIALGLALCCLMPTQPALADVPPDYPLIWEDDHHLWSDGYEEWLNADGEWVTEDPSGGDGQKVSDPGAGTNQGQTGDVPVVPEVDPIQQDPEQDEVPKPDDENNVAQVPLLAIVLSICVGVAAIAATAVILMLGKRRRSTVRVKPAHLKRR